MNKAEVQLQIDLLSAQLIVLAKQRLVEDDRISKLAASRAAQDAANADRSAKLQEQLAAAPN